MEQTAVIPASGNKFWPCRIAPLYQNLLIPIGSSLTRRVGLNWSEEWALGAGSAV